MPATKVMLKLVIALTIFWSLFFVYKQNYDRAGDYFKQDSQGEHIDCEAMLSDFAQDIKWNSDLDAFDMFPFLDPTTYWREYELSNILYDIELDKGISFSQCREQIDAQHAKRCAAVISPNATQLIAGQHRTERCDQEIRNHVAAIDSTFEFRGNALLVNDLVIPRQHVVLGKPRSYTYHLPNVLVYTFTISGGNYETRLEYGDESSMKRARAELTAFVAGGLQ